MVLVLCLSILGCAKPQTKKEKTSTLSIKTDSTQNKEEKERLERRKQIEKENRRDSINLSKLLDSSLTIAQRHINAFKYTTSFEVTMDSSYNVKTKITIGHFFSPGKKHLIIKRNSVNGDYSDIFLIDNNQFKKVIHHEEIGQTFLGDTIRDVNGDGCKDYLINWYGSTGCCLKNFYDVYLYQSDGTFSSMYEFINPTFSANEKIIRGVCYGHPGETGLYKYKWNGLRVDTIEFIYPDKKNKGYYLKLDKLPQKPQKTERIKTVPKEYRKIYGYDWFLGKV